MNDQEELNRIVMHQNCVDLMLKAALEYNAAVVSLACAWVGNVNTQKDATRYGKRIDKLTKQYTDQLEELTSLML